MNNEQRLAKAKTQLVLDHPFIGTIALQKLEFSIHPESWFEERGMPATAAVSDREAMFCDEFMDTLNDSELTFLVAHECFHPMLEHNWRRNSRDPMMFNQAADYVINKLLRDERIGSMPECGLHDESIYAEGGGTSEGIYTLLQQQQSESPDGGGDGDGSGNKQMDTIIEATGTPAEQGQAAQEWRIAVAQAAQAAKIMGKLSANMERFVSEFLESKVNWRDVLYRFIEKARTDQRTFARPNRRLITQGLYMPSVSGERMGELVFAVDCSGSISQHEVNQYAAEIKRVHEDLKPSTVHLVYFDSRVAGIDSFSPDDEVVLNPRGGGGTAFSPIFRAIDEQGIDPVACVVLTDLYCNDYGDAPHYPVLWVSTSDRNETPFGDVVPLTIEQ